MTRTIEIEGGLARIVDKVLVQELPLADAMPLIENRPPVTLPVLPKNHVVSAYWDESDPASKTLELLVSIDPATRLLPYDVANRYGDECRVALPYTVFHFRLIANQPNPQGRHWTFDSTRVFFARENPKNLDQQVIAALLPNVYSDGRICFGNTAVPVDQPLSDRVDQLVNEWYLSEFADHHVREYPWPWAKRTGRGYRKWVTESARDPRCWTQWPEWDLNDTHQQHWRLGDLFGQPIHNTDAMTVIGAIPQLPEQPTFGRAEQWLNGLTPTQRFRLRTALANIEAEAPETIVEEPDEEDEE